MVLRFGVYYGIILHQQNINRHIELIEIEALLEAIIKDSVSKSMWRIECVNNDNSLNNTILIYHSGYSTISNGKTILLSDESGSKSYDEGCNSCNSNNKEFIKPSANLANINTIAHKLVEDITIYLSPYIDGHTSYINYHVGYFLDGGYNK